MTCSDRIQGPGSQPDAADPARIEQSQAELATPQQQIPGLIAALESSREIGVSIGILMAGGALTRQQAFDALSSASQHQNLSLREVARWVIDTGVLERPVLAEPSSRAAVSPPRSAPRQIPSPVGPVPAPPVAADKADVLGLTLERERAVVSLGGEVDLCAVENLNQLLASLDALPMPVYVDMSAVTFIDTSGLEPFVEATRRREHARMPSLLLEGCSPAVRRLLDLLGLSAGPELNVEAWDAMTARY